LIWRPHAQTQIGIINFRAHLWIKLWEGYLPLARDQIAIKRKTYWVCGQMWFIPTIRD
jgi:hypothetical protein